MAKREFLMLAHNYNADKYGIGGWFMSEKLDGQRFFWDGGITRGMYADEVPFANTEKDGRYVSRIKATGLWSRYGKTIQAPDWWLNKLPPFPLDGEGYLGRGGFQELASIVKQLNPTDDWVRVMYMVFDSPNPDIVFSDGHINNTNFKKRFKDVRHWVLDQIVKQGKTYFRFNSFETAYKTLQRQIVDNEVVKLLYQQQLPFSTQDAVALANSTLDKVTDADGEGLILRHPMSTWVPERSHRLLKVKKWQDAEGVVIGYTWGRQTDKGSKLLGLMGALILQYGHHRFELSGFTDEERRMAIAGANGNLDYITATRIGINNPGKEVQNGVINPAFPLGSVVTFRYRELTDAGIPKESRYLRKRPNE